MATINLGSQHGKRKNVDAEVPLIPFIDLLLCCVMFLLVTAVWNQLGSHEVVQDVPGAAAPDVLPREQLQFVLHVSGTGYVLSSSAGESFEIPKLAGAYDLAALSQRLKSYHDVDPNRHDLTLVADDDVTYETLVQAMDTAAAEGFRGFSFSES
jgi:biopolymer transport protein ExbD